MIPVAFDYQRASSIDDAIAKLAASGGGKLIAGGHSLLPMMKLRLAVPDVVSPGACAMAPATDSYHGASTVAESEAVRLFVERARTADPTFALSAHNAPTIAQICARLDGIPLAIELAAARVRALSVRQIADRLDDRFHLLTGGSRTALPRQRTLRGAGRSTCRTISTMRAWVGAAQPASVALRTISPFSSPISVLRPFWMSCAIEGRWVLLRACALVPFCMCASTAASATCSRAQPSSASNAGAARSTHSQTTTSARS